MKGKQLSHQFLFDLGSETLCYIFSLQNRRTLRYQNRVFICLSIHSLSSAMALHGHFPDRGLQKCTTLAAVAEHILPAVLWPSMLRNSSSTAYLEEQDALPSASHEFQSVNRGIGPWHHLHSIQSCPTGTCDVTECTNSLHLGFKQHKHQDSGCHHTVAQRQRKVSLHFLTLFTCTLCKSIQKLASKHQALYFANFAYYCHKCKT